jgi:hypothetical protein
MCSYIAVAIVNGGVAALCIVIRKTFLAQQFCAVLAHFKEGAVVKFKQSEIVGAEAGMIGVEASSAKLHVLARLKLAMKICGTL